MKVFKKTLCIFLSFCILILTVALPAYANGEQRFGKSILSKMDNSAALIFVYDKLVEGVKNSTPNIPILHGTHKVTWDEVTIIYRAFHNDYPEYFWINGEYNPFWKIILENFNPVPAGYRAGLSVKTVFFRSTPEKFTKDAEKTFLVM